MLRYLISGLVIERIRLSNVVQCTLAIGDLQILTGLSILISGYIQLSKDLSAYHWMVIVDLAWFSSLTHLACLTLLRNFFFNHPLQRMARLSFMGVLAILLVVGLSFTGHYAWLSLNYDNLSFEISVVLSGYPTYTDLTTIAYPATCRSIPNPIRHPTTWVYSSMVVSIVLIAFGFLGRVIKLHEFLSVSLCARLRSWASIPMRRFLRYAFSRCCLDRSPTSLRRTLVYRPLLTVFIVAELCLDWWSSFLLEASHSNVDFLIII